MYWFEFQITHNTASLHAAYTIVVVTVLKKWRFNLIDILEAVCGVVELYCFTLRVVPLYNAGQRVYLITFRAINYEVMTGSDPWIVSLLHPSYKAVKLSRGYIVHLKLQSELWPLGQQIQKQRGDMAAVAPELYICTVLFSVPLSAGKSPENKSVPMPCSVRLKALILHQKDNSMPIQSCEYFKNVILQSLVVD